MVSKQWARSRMIVTDWGSYLVPEELLKDFKESLKLNNSLAITLAQKEARFNKRWGEYMIRPA